MLSLCRGAEVFLAVVLACRLASAGELLYNGIELPDDWPPRMQSFARGQPQTPPYLKDPPAVISIDVGRQLLVDDFLIQSTTLVRTYHRPTWHEKSPVLRAETPWEFHGDRNIPFAAPFSDGIWWDPKDQLFKMWYMGGTTVYFCYATSRDGIQWQRPALDTFRKGTNILKIEPIQRDSSTVWLDLEETDPNRRYKLVYYRSGLFTRFSADGIHWSDPVARHNTGDRTTMFYNPFRKVWVYSVRGSRNGVGRFRYYAETRDLGQKVFNSTGELPAWACADEQDRLPGVAYAGQLPDLYCLDATPYESLMLGLFTIHSKVAEGDRPKLNRVSLGYSRDSFHWYRPDRRPFLDVSDDKHAWNYGNVQSVGGGCLVMGDKLYFYASGRNSRKPTDDGSGASTGLAILRRDGFASLDAGPQGGTLTTRVLRTQGKHLFVNVDCPAGRLQAEILSEAGEPIEPYTLVNSQPLSVDSTAVELKWANAASIAPLAGKSFRLRLHLTSGRLYSFWSSPDASGASHGYVAAGGWGFTSNRDTIGRNAASPPPK